MQFISGLHQFLFGVYPYICMAVFAVGSLVRFDRDPYTWKSDSSQLLRAGLLRWGSNLFHVGVLFIFFGHLFGLLTPHWGYAWLMTPGQKQLLAMISGGIAGALAMAGLTILIYRRIIDPRIRSNTRAGDVLVLTILWLQLALGLISIAFSVRHLDGSLMLLLAEWAQRIVTFQAGAAALIVAAPWIFKAHLVLGMTIFLVFPFTRLVHIWSGFAAVAYLFRPYQLVRTRRRLSSGLQELR
jgi:nitrate reductase gamma subunit